MRGYYYFCRFYEWKREGTQKQPMLFYHSQSSHIQLHRPELESIDAGEWRGRRPMLLASIFDVVNLMFCYRRQ
jgi:hypothetical protein